MKGIIIYESKHHGNTKKLAEELAKSAGFETLDVLTKQEIDFSLYDVIGIASGIAIGKFYQNVLEYTRKIPEGKKTFFLYTCARNDKNYAAAAEKIARSNGCEVLGEYGCRGFNTFAFLKLIGGINKGCPTQEEIRNGIEFITKILN